MAPFLFKWLLLSLFPLAVSPAAEESASNPEAKHPFYVSVTEISHNAGEKSLEISCKLFADDLEDVLKRNYKKPVDFTDTKQQNAWDALVRDYISRNLKLMADGKALPLQYVGFEKDKESVYCYFEAGGQAAPKKLDVSNSILQDFTDKQINIMHVTVNGNRKSHKLDYPVKEASFSF